MSQSTNSTRRPHSPETKEKIRQALLGKPLTAERRAKISAAKRGICPPEHVMELAHEAWRGQKHTDETKRVIGQTHSGKKYGPKTRARISRAAKARFGSMTHEEILALSSPGRDAAARRTSRTSIEIAVSETLSSLGIMHVCQQKFGPFRADIFIPSMDLVVECDGDYWHSLPGRVETDARRDAYLNSAGYQVVRLTESEIREDVLSAVVRGLTL